MHWSHLTRHLPDLTLLSADNWNAVERSLGSQAVSPDQRVNHDEAVPNRGGLQVEASNGGVPQRPADAVFRSLQTWTMSSSTLCLPTCG